MKYYTVHLRRHGLDPDKDMILVAEGFCWPAFAFAGLWALWQRLWLPGLLILGLEFGLGAVMALIGADGLAVTAAVIGWRTLVGFAANDIHRWGLDRWYFVPMGVVAAPDREAAEHRFLAAMPQIAAGMRV